MKKPNFVLISLATFIFFIIGIELFFRFFFFLYNDYDIEMWKYNRHLKVLVSDSRQFVHRPNRKVKIMGVTVCTNNLGFRDVSENINILSSLDRKIVFSIGDSMTLGFGVNVEDTFTSLLDEMLNRKNGNKYKILNLGVGNYNFNQNLATLKTNIKQVKVNAVLFNFFLNDLEETHIPELNFFNQNSYLYIFAATKFRKISMLFKANYLNSYYFNLYNEKKIEKLESLFSELQALSRLHAFKVYFIIIPDLRKLRPYPYVELERKIEVLATKQLFRVISTTSEFENKEERQFWVSFDDPHPNKIAHKIIANKIFRSINNGD